MPEDTFRWGILGLGNIARIFATGLKSAPGAKLVAVGSRSQEKADAFGNDFDAPHRYATYEALANDPDIDAVYVATPHPMHAEAALIALRAGKAVLCEKPFTLNAAQAESVINEARSRKVFLLEAMWTRFLPVMTQVRKMVADGAIGELLMIDAAFGFRAGFNPKSRLFDPVLGGGALLDVGVYTVSFSSMLFGTPSAITGLAVIGETGVDELDAIAFTHSGGRISNLRTALRLTLPSDAFLLGTEGSIKIHSPWWKSSAITLSTGGKSEEIACPIEGNGYNYEAVEVERCVRAGLLESPTLPLHETLSVMKTMDDVRAQWGLRYPMEGN